MKLQFNSKLQRCAYARFVTSMNKKIIFSKFKIIIVSVRHTVNKNNQIVQGGKYAKQKPLLLKFCKHSMEGFKYSCPHNISVNLCMQLNNI